ncbi:DUF4229 domain-containing protein [Streptomyces sp. H27-D2]|uniref:DUF4229 domain-containing protein n=1 Tax=Streptomyces sp. H27-D2 TaxID=3046304 RepID=UPI002DBD923C|nr:DUF4229 domain-containing protein [Streptomyces sp. H27-D2]MEC4017018.1 DUF4229 domain-containing protein [Streptomyces sp. H27-D2]
MSLKPSATFRYTTMRLAVFVGCFLAVLVLVRLEVLPSGFGDSNLMWVVLLALVLSAPLSFILLRKQRDAMSESLVERVDRTKQRFAENRSQEDGANDAAARSQG